MLRGGPSAVCAIWEKENEGTDRGTTDKEQEEMYNMGEFRLALGSEFPPGDGTWVECATGVVVIFFLSDVA